jgi:hypothetical protein
MSEVAPPGVNPHPHVDVFGGPEVTAWPDGMVGLAWRGEHGFNVLYTPCEAEAIGWALLRMARVARPAYLGLDKGTPPSGGP